MHDSGPWFLKEVVPPALVEILKPLRHSKWHVVSAPVPFRWEFWEVESSAGRWHCPRWSAEGMGDCIRWLSQKELPRWLGPLAGLALDGNPGEAGGLFSEFSCDARGCWEPPQRLERALLLERPEVLGFHLVEAELTLSEWPEEACLLEADSSGELCALSLGKEVLAFDDGAMAFVSQGTLEEHVARRASQWVASP